MPSVLAKEALQRSGGAGLSVEEYHDLVLQAFGSKRTAEEMARRRAAEQMRRGEQPI